MKYSVVLLVSLFALASCTQSFHERQLRGTYKIDTKALADNHIQPENDLLGIGRAFLNNAEFTLTFEEAGVARMRLNMVMVEGLLNALGADIDMDGGPGVPIEWKIEGNKIFLAENEDEWQLLGEVVDFRGYEEITLEVENDKGEPVLVSMKRMEEK